MTAKAGERNVAGLPLGGSTGDVLTKSSDDDLDTEWGAGGSGGSFNGGTITEPLDIELAADAVGLTVHAAPGGGANVVEFVPDNPFQAISIDSFGRFVSQAFGFLGIHAGDSFEVSIPATSLFKISNDDTGDSIIKAIAGAPDTLGFFNATPTARPTVSAASMTLAADLLDALDALGLIDKTA